MALSRLGLDCVFASEIDPELRDLYLRNFPGMAGRVFGDIRHSKDRVPDHDILCAGFPCQPFSKSGGQLGMRDETRGTLFHEILEILKKKKPRFVLLENVGNFARHDQSRTWRIVRERLEDFGYHVRGTEHKTPAARSDWRDVGSGPVALKKPAASLEADTWRGHGLISPHHFGFPQHRERFFIAASLDGLPEPAFPSPSLNSVTQLMDIVQPFGDLTPDDRRETRLSEQHLRCIEHWNRFLRHLPKSTEIPSFPLWGDELNARYPYERRTPWATPPVELGRALRTKFPKYTRKANLLAELPSYAREETDAFRHWKVRYIRQNREWWKKVSDHLPAGWEDRLRLFPASLRKLEWNAKGEDRDLWKHVLQFRPSGLRVKRYTTSPALVAMTATQIPVLGPARRFLTRTEGRRLQGLPDSHLLPTSRDAAFTALGNAVHVGLIEYLAVHLLSASDARGVADVREAVA